MQLPGRHVVVTGAAGGVDSAPVHDAIVDEWFLLLPHPEVADDLTLEATDPPQRSSGTHDLRRRVLCV